MTTEGLQALGATLALMDAPYGNVWTDAKIALYQTALKNVPDAAALAALERIALTRPLRPAPSEILEEIARLTDPAPTLAGAIEQIRDKFFRNKTVFLHPAVEKMTDAMGGPSVIGRMEDFAERAARIYDKCVKEDREQTAAFVAAGIVAPSLPTGTGAMTLQTGLGIGVRALPGLSPSEQESLVTDGFLKCPSCGFVAAQTIMTTDHGTQHVVCAKCGHSIGAVGTSGPSCATGDCDSVAKTECPPLHGPMGDDDEYDYAADDLAFDAARERGR